MSGSECAKDASIKYEVYELVFHGTFENIVNIVAHIRSQVALL